MTIRRLAVLSCTAAALSACAQVNPLEVADLEARYADSIPVCASSKECEVKWAAARNWMLSRCGLRLEKVTDDYMETYKSGDYSSTALYCRVVKTPLSGNAYRIDLTAGSNNWFMHSAQDILKIKVDFNETVNRAWTQMAPAQ